MLRVYVAIAALFLIAASYVWVYWEGQDKGETGVVIDQLEGTLENAEKFNNGASDTSGLSWYERLFPGDPAPD